MVRAFSRSNNIGQLPAEIVNYILTLAWVDNILASWSKSAANRVAVTRPSILQPVWRQSNYLTAVSRPRKTRSVFRSDADRGPPRCVEDRTRTITDDPRNFSVISGVSSTFVKISPRPRTFAKVLFDEIREPSPRFSVCIRDTAARIESSPH